VYSYIYVFIRRFLSVLESEDIDSERLSDQLAQGYRADRAVRIGSITVHTVGLPTIDPDLKGTHTGYYILCIYMYT
jgi:hypothetical protein